MQKILVLIESIHQIPLNELLGLDICVERLTNKAFDVDSIFTMCYGLCPIIIIIKKCSNWAKTGLK